MLSTDQSFEMFPRHIGSTKISESLHYICEFLYHQQISNYLLQFNAGFNKFFFRVTLKLMEYIFPAISVRSNPCVGPFPRTNMSFFHYQYYQKNSYILQKLIHSDQIHHQEMRSLIFYQIQFHKKNTHIFQYLRFFSK